MGTYSTGTFPYNCVVLIEGSIPAEPGHYSQGSGVVIGPHTILTATHVVEDVTTGDALTNIKLYPGWSSSDPAQGAGYISTTYTDHYYNLSSPNDSLYKYQSAYDFAVIDTSYTFSSWMGVETNFTGGTVHLTGYPATAGGYQTDQTGTVSADQSYDVLDYGTISSSPGASGGPLWINDAGSDNVVGIVSTSGWACKLTTSDWNTIQSWGAEDGYTLWHVAPTVAAPKSLSLFEGESVAVSSLVSSITNPSQDSITQTICIDRGGGSGYFTVNGVRQADGQWIYPSTSDNVKYVAGNSPGSDTLQVGIYDSTTNSYSYSGNITVTTFDTYPTTHANDLTYAATASGANHFIDLSNFEASYSDLIGAFGTNQAAMQNWYSTYEPIEHRGETFDGLDYVASYSDLMSAFSGAGSMKAIQDDGAAHFITNGQNEGRTTSFNGLDYIASYRDLMTAFGASNDAGAYHYIENGHNEGRSITFDGLDYIASYRDLINAFGANEQAGAAHFIANGHQEGRTTSFDGLAYIANYTDLINAFGANNDAGATHYINYGHNEGRSATFNVAGYESAHPDLVGKYSSADALLTAYIETYKMTGTFLT